MTHAVVICECCYHPFEPDEPGAEFTNVPLKLITVDRRGRPIPAYEIGKAWICARCVAGDDPTSVDEVR